MREKIPLDFIHIGLHRTGSTFLQKKIFSDVGDVKILQFNDQKTLRNEFDDLILIPHHFLMRAWYFSVFTQDLLRTNIEALAQRVCLE